MLRSRYSLSHKCIIFYSFVIHVRTVTISVAIRWDGRRDMHKSLGEGDISPNILNRGMVHVLTPPMLIPSMGDLLKCTPIFNNFSMHKITKYTIC